MFWGGSTILDDFGYFLMILGVFGAIRVESRPTKCLTGDITSTLGGIRNVVEVATALGIIRDIYTRVCFREHKRFGPKL